MKLFEYKCTTCNCRMTTSHGPADRYEADCPECDSTGPHTRYFGSISVRPGMPEHYNQTVSKRISSMAQFKNELSKKQDEYMETTGMPARFVPIDLRDPASCGATEEGLEATRKQTHDQRVAGLVA